MAKKRIDPNKKNNLSLFHSSLLYGALGVFILSVLTFVFNIFN